MMDVIQETKTVYVVWRNSDLTEGRGPQVVHKVAETKDAARRLAKRADVQGTDAKVNEGLAVKIKNQWLIPGNIEPETKKDKDERERRERAEQAMQKARDAGLTDKELDMIFVERNAGGSLK